MIMNLYSQCIHVTFDLSLSSFNIYGTFNFKIEGCNTGKRKTNHLIKKKENIYTQRETESERERERQR